MSDLCIKSGAPVHHCTVYTVHSVQWTVYSVQGTLYIVLCTVYCAQCTVYSVHCIVYIVYSVQCTQWPIHRVRRQSLSAHCHPMGLLLHPEEGKFQTFAKNSFLLLTIFKLGLNHIFVNSENLGIIIWWGQKTTKKNNWWHDCVNLIFTQMHSFSSFWQVLHYITMLFTYHLHIFHHLQDLKKIFSKFNIICMFKDPDFTENFTNLAKNHQKCWTQYQLKLKSCDYGSIVY